MADHRDAESVEKQDRGLFDFLGNKKDEEEKKKHPEESISHDLDHKVHISEPVHVSAEPEPVHKPEEEKHEGLLQKLTRSGSSSSSSSEEEEVDENGEKKKKKKLKEKKQEADTSVPVEKVDEPEEKKGLVDKIKEKLPGGGQKKESDEVPPPPPAAECHDGDAGKEKKGILEKIKEKLPGYHSKGEEEKEKEKDGGH